MSMKKQVIAIDGPASSGKSTTAKLVARRLGFIYLDTGAMYRAITLKALRNRISPEDGKALARIARESKLDLVDQNGMSKVYLDGEDVTELIRKPEINKLVSEVSLHKEVRAALVSKQKEIGQKHDLVAEGRDTTTVVFPDAALKVYLDCDIKERAKRRMLEFKGKGINTTLKEQEKELSGRDKIDSEREASPLKKDPEAIIVDTTNLSIQEQVEKIVQLYEKSKKDEIPLSGSRGHD